MPPSVTRWPSYLLKHIPPTIRTELSQQAKAEDVSVQDVVRGILCARYRLNCPPASYGYRPDLDSGVGETVLLRLQKKLKRALDREARETGLPLRTIIISALEAHYERKAA